MTSDNPIVFVVDDDYRIREALSSLIASVGLRVTAYGSAAEFLEAEKPDAPACLVLDLQLPGSSGLELQRELADGSGPPIVFITGHGDIPSSVRAMKAGAVGSFPSRSAMRNCCWRLTRRLQSIGKDGGRGRSWRSYRSTTRGSPRAKGRYCPSWWPVWRISRPPRNSAPARSPSVVIADRSCARWVRDRSPNSSGWPTGSRLRGQRMARPRFPAELRFNRL